MFDHRVEDRLVADAGSGQAELVGQRFLSGTSRCARRFPSAPDSRTISNVLREVPHAGLWWIRAFIARCLLEEISAAVQRSRGGSVESVAKFVAKPER